MRTLGEILLTLDKIAPLALAESWDNVGLLAGDPALGIGKLLTCLTLTEGVLQEAIDSKANLIVSHHPIPFKPIDRITTKTTTGKVLWKAIQHSIAIYSPHTAWDNAPEGINRQLAKILRLGNLRCLQPSPKPDLAARELGTGIVGELNKPTKLSAVWSLLKDAVPEIQARSTAQGDPEVSRLGIVCGSGASLLHLAQKNHCDAFLTGEATYHQVLEAQATGVSMLLMGHFASERFAMKTLARLLQEHLPEVQCLSSQWSTRNFESVLQRPVRSAFSTLHEPYEDQSNDNDPINDNLTDQFREHSALVARADEPIEQTLVLVPKSIRI
ncbi:MAG: Nif3-like dinuclear metal center hexameric protein [Planctomycetaceae bacterium]|nr:Nif3-like dinuclear metal center hexameric protein [Planctomycetaceae bacterium]